MSGAFTGGRALTLTEKIIARAAGQGGVGPGDEVWARADRVIMNDSSGPRRIAHLVASLGGVHAPERAVIASDHFVPAATSRHAEILRLTRTWAQEQGIAAFHEYEGILHNLVLERWHVQPGMLLVGADSHTVSAGAAAAVAVAVGSTELATVLASGEVWLRVPESIRVDLEGALPPWVDARDVTMRILGDLGTDHALYRAVEYGGGWLDTATMEARLVLANQAIEMGAKNGIVEPAAPLLAALAAAGLASDQAPPRPDPGARYLARHAYDLGRLGPLVAAHPSPDNVYPVEDLRGAPIDMAWIGSCAGGRAADLRAAASVLRGQRARVPLLVTPATRAIYAEAAADGTLAALADAGATVLPPGCGACAGVHAGVQGPGDRVIATATRNFPGRMGSREAEVYLGSPFTVAASAIAGRIADPRAVAAGGQR